MSCTGKNPLGITSNKKKVAPSVANGHQQRRRLVPQHHLERAPVERDDALKHFFGLPVEPSLFVFRLVAQQARAHHRRERQRNHRGNQNRDAERDGELAKQPSHNVAHEQQRDQHRDQRYRQRENGEADLFGAFERGLQRRIAPLDIARDVLDHHDGVVHHEAGRNGQRHQGEVVQAVPEQVHHAESSHQRQTARPRWGSRSRPASAETERSPSPPGRW